MKTNRFINLAAVLIVVFAAQGFLSAPASAATRPDLDKTQSAQIIRLTNQLREKNGLKPLVRSDRLDRAATGKAFDMLANQYFSHRNPDGENMVLWLNQAGYRFAFAGENLAKGFENGNDVMAAWQKSPTHLANLIDPDFTEIGVAVVVGTYKNSKTFLLVQLFGTPQITDAASAVPKQKAVSVKTAHMTPAKFDQGKTAVGLPEHLH